MRLACVCTLMVIPSPSSGRSHAWRLPLHTGNTSKKSTRPARLRHCAAVTLSEQSVPYPHAWLCNPVSDASHWRLG